MPAAPTDEVCCDEREALRAHGSLKRGDISDSMRNITIDGSSSNTDQRPVVNLIMLLVIIDLTNYMQGGRRASGSARSNGTDDRCSTISLLLDTTY